MKMKNFVLIAVVTLLTLSFLIVTPNTSRAAFFTASITGQSQGVIGGDNLAKGQEGTIVVNAILNEAEMPLEPGTFTPSSAKPIYTPFSLAKFADSASVKLFMAFADQELLPLVEIKFYRISKSGGGQLEHYFTIKLVNAHIVDISTESTGEYKNQSEAEVQESLGFTWGKMVIIDEVNSLQTEIIYAPPS